MMISDCSTCSLVYTHSPRSILLPDSEHRRNRSWYRLWCPEPRMRRCEIQWTDESDGHLSSAGGAGLSDASLSQSTVSVLATLLETHVSHTTVLVTALLHSTWHWQHAAVTTTDGCPHTTMLGIRSTIARNTWDHDSVKPVTILWSQYLRIPQDSCKLVDCWQPRTWHWVHSCQISHMGWNLSELV